MSPAAASALNLVTREELLAARRRLRGIVFEARMAPEPSGAVPVAAALFHSDALPRAVAVLSGGNVEPEAPASVLAEAV